MLPTESTTARADPDLVVAWLRARSSVRKLPQPVAAHGGWRVDTDLPNERCRYVFAYPTATIRVLAATLDIPRVFLKLCGSAEELSPLLTSDWQVLPPATMMTRMRHRDEGVRRLHGNYRLQTSSDGPTTKAEILTANGTVAAQGYACESGGVFIYDRIATDPAHGRQGLATVVMAALASARRSSAAPEILVATADGRALYRTIGFSDHSPYTTATVPPSGQPPATDPTAGTPP